MTSPASATRRVGRPPGPRQDPLERREALLDACVRAIRRHGADVPMADLAAEAGVSRPILYDHFGDRAGVARALVARYGQQLDGALESAFDRPVPLRQAITDGIDLFCRFVEADPEVYRFLRAAAEPAGAAQVDELSAFDAAIGSRVGETLARALAAAGGDPAMGRAWGFGIIGMVFMAGEWWSSTRQVTRETLVAHLGALIDGGLAGAGIAETPGPFA